MPQSAVEPAIELGRQDPQVGNVHQHVAGDHHQRAADHRPRYVALRPAHLAGDEGAVLPATVAEHHRHHGEEQRRPARGEVGSGTTTFQSRESHEAGRGRGGRRTISRVEGRQLGQGDDVLHSTPPPDAADIERGSAETITASATGCLEALAAPGPQGAQVGGEESGDDRQGSGDDHQDQAPSRRGMPASPRRAPRRRKTYTPPALRQEPAQLGVGQASR